MQSCEFSYLFFYPYSIDKLEDNQYCLDNEYLYHFSITSPITFTIFPYFFPKLISLLYNFPCATSAKADNHPF